MIDFATRPPATPIEAYKFLRGIGLSHDEAVGLTKTRKTFEFYVRTLDHMVRQ